MANHDLWQGGPWEQPNHVPPERIVRVEAPQRPKRKKRKKVLVFLGTVGLICALTAAAVAAGRGDMPWNRPSSPSHFGQEGGAPQLSLPLAEWDASVTLTITPAHGDPLSFSQVYEKNAQSIVTVQAADHQGFSEGTGIVLTADGYIITNAHVINGAFRAMVYTQNDVRYEARLVGISREEDLAVLKVDSANLIPAEFGDSFALRVGDQVSALGNPLGYRMSLTSGIISAIDRELEVDGNTMHLLQTSAAINSGNSGGALFNDRGQVIGVTVVKIVTDDGSTEGLGFAIPSERVKYVVDHLIAREEMRVPALGVTVQQNPERKGLEVLELQDWSGAHAGGLQVGDLMLSANGHPTTTNRDLERVKDLLRVGDTLTLEVLRNGERLTCPVVLVDWAESYADPEETD